MKGEFHHTQCPPRKYKLPTNFKALHMKFEKRQGPMEEQINTARVTTPRSSHRRPHNRTLS